MLSQRLVRFSQDDHIAMANNTIFDTHLMRVIACNMPFSAQQHFTDHDRVPVIQSVSCGHSLWVAWLNQPT